MYSFLSFTLRFGLLPGLTSRLYLFFPLRIPDETWSYVSPNLSANWSTVYSFGWSARNSTICLSFSFLKSNSIPVFYHVKLYYNVKCCLTVDKKVTRCIGSLQVFDSWYASTDLDNGVVHRVLLCSEYFISAPIVGERPTIAVIVGNKLVVCYLLPAQEADTDFFHVPSPVFSTLIIHLVHTRFMHDVCTAW